MSDQELSTAVRETNDAVKRNLFRDLIIRQNNGDISNDEMFQILCDEFNHAEIKSISNSSRSPILINENPELSIGEQSPYTLPMKKMRRAFTADGSTFKKLDRSQSFFTDDGFHHHQPMPIRQLFEKCAQARGGILNNDNSIADKYYSCSGNCSNALWGCMIDKSIEAQKNCKGRKIDKKNDQSNLIPRIAKQYLSYSEQRANQRERAVLEQEKLKYTFHPEINQFSAKKEKDLEKGLQFLERVNHWHSKKSISLETKQQQLKTQEMIGCSFKPEINHNSKRAACAKRRANIHSATEDGHEVLEIYNRLHHDANIRDKKYGRRLDEKKVNEQQEIDRCCTFEPAILGNISMRHVSSRHRQAADLRRRSIDDKLLGRKQIAEHSELRECTFTPSIIGAKVNMPNAKEYLQINVIDRLSNPPIQSSNPSNVNIKSIPKQAWTNPKNDSLNTTCSTSGSNPAEGKLSRLEISPFNAELHAEIDALEKDTLTSPSSNMPSHKYPTKNRLGLGVSDGFLIRQRQWEERRAAKIKQTSQNEDLTFRPKICKNSTLIHGSIHNGSFLQRLTYESRRRERNAAMLYEALDKEREYSFSPKITSLSQQKQGRSVNDMSIGDQLRREANLRAARIRYERDKLEDFTFEPQLYDGPLSKVISSNLKLFSDLESYTARVSARKKRREERSEASLKAKEAAEDADCTFTPQTIECPPYVKRIAIGIAEARAIAEAENQCKKPAKPSWR